MNLTFALCSSADHLWLIPVGFSHVTHLILFMTVLVRNLGVKIQYEISLTIYETVSRKSSPQCLRGKRLRGVS